MANIDWSTQSATELNRWQVKRHYLADIRASRSADGDFIYKTNVVSDGIISVSRSTTAGTFNLRRELNHIRHSNIQTYTIYFSIQGEISFTQDGMHGLCRRNEMFILNSDRPLTINTLADGKNPQEMLLVTVPAHVFHSVLPHANRICGHTLSAERGLAKFSRQIFLGVLDTGDEVGEDLMSTFLLGGVQVAAKAISSNFPTDIVPARVSQAHLDRVKKYIDQHLSDQELCVTLTAAGCGISRRYIHLLMSRDGTTFADYVRKRRLELANRWLRSGEFSHVTIEWIARAVGFKSCSHFGRLYRAQFGCSPRVACLMHEGQERHQ